MSFKTIAKTSWDVVSSPFEIVGKGTWYGLGNAAEAFVNPAYVGGSNYVNKDIQPDAVGAAMNETLAKIGENPGQIEYWKYLGDLYAAEIGTPIPNFEEWGKDINNSWQNLVKETTEGWGDFIDGKGDWAEAQRFLDDILRKHEVVLSAPANLGGGGYLGETDRPAESFEKQTKDVIQKYVKAYSDWHGNKSVPYINNNQKNADASASQGKKSIGQTISDWWKDNTSIDNTKKEDVNSIYFISSDYKSDDSEKFNEKPKQDIAPVIAKNLMNKRSLAVQQMLNSGPDFLRHHFDLWLFVLKNENNSYTDIFEKVFDEEKTPFNNKNTDHLKTLFRQNSGFIFSVRTAAIDIPQIESDTFELKFGFETIKKVRSKVKFERKAELKMLLDEPLYLNLFINLMSNNNQVRYDVINSSNRENKYYNNFNYYSPFSTLKVINEGLVNKAVRVDLVIAQNFYQGYPELEDTREVWRTIVAQNQETQELIHNFPGLRPDEQPLWWFEDISFLGQGSDLIFNRDNSSETEMTYPFIFKRVSKIDRQRKYDNKKDGKRLSKGDVDGELKKFFEFEPDLTNNFKF